LHMQALALPEKVCVAASQLLLSMFLFLRCRCALRCAEQVHLHFAACSDTFAAVCADVGSPAWRPCRYCECYQHGQPCHSRCTCADCGNNGQLTLSGEVSLGGLGCKCFGLPAPQGPAQTAVFACMPHACRMHARLASNILWFNMLTVPGLDGMRSHQALPLRHPPPLLLPGRW